MSRVEVIVGSYRVIASDDVWPEMLASYRANATLAEDFPEPGDGGKSFFAVSSQSQEWPELVVTQNYEPEGYGFQPGLLIVPETGIVFIGAGERLLAYRMKPEPQRLWEDRAGVGFWSWSRHGDFVILSAELEVAAWSTDGVKLWTAPVDPPWNYEIDGDRLTLDVAGTKRTISLASGAAL